MLSQQELKKFVKDRSALLLGLGFGLSTIIVCGLLLLWLQPSDVQIPIRYNGYNVDFSNRPGNLFNDQWYERTSFIVFAVLQLLGFGWLAVKMFNGGYRVMSKFLIAGGILSLVVLALIGFFVNRTVTL